MAILLCHSARRSTFIRIRSRRKYRFYFNAAQLSFGIHNGYQVSNDFLNFGCLRIVNTEVISKINLRSHQLPLPTKYATQYTLIIEVISLRNRFRQVDFECITAKHTCIIIIFSIDFLLID